MREYIETSIIMLVLIIGTITVLMSIQGCTTTKSISKYDVNCSECRVHVTYDIEGNQLEKGF